MKEKTYEILKSTLENNKNIVKLKEKILLAYELLEKCYLNGGKVLICGNGGSSSDGEHIVGELMKGFLLKRTICENKKKKIIEKFPEDGEFLSSNLQGALPAISLSSHIALNTAFINDVSYEMNYAQQVFGYGRKGDVLIALTTSGNSKNVINAAKIAKVLDMNIITLKGNKLGKIDEISSVVIDMPSEETYRIQEYTIIVYHCLCAMLEEEFFGKKF